MRMLAPVLLLPLFAGAAAAAEEVPPRHRLPFLAEEARKRGIELPLPFGAGAVYYHLDRAIEITDVRVGRDGAPPVSVPDAVQFGADSRVDNANLKLDVWLLPFLNVYAIAGYIWNESDTSLEVTLPPLLPGGSPRRRRVEVPTSLTGSVGGLGITLAGGYGPFFFAADCNGARADLGFDDRFKAVVTSIRAGWFGEAGGRPIRVWFNGTDWNTFATATGTVADPDDGSTLQFEVDQGPAKPRTYGIGASYSPRPAIELSLDSGTDFDGGWYVAVVPVFRF
ncbi:MAG TPA: hypothetical protein VFV75_11440 [Candidatus Polarisedimenticolaceae bacterium]|nr:hypothetical protein [Candidatus Polarisedimenticolaceae bacterium]